MRSGEIITAKDALSDKSIVDYIATIPYSSNIEIVDDHLAPVLSIMSRLVTDASVELWGRHQNAQLILIGETCYPGLPSTADLMHERVLATKQDVPQNKMVVLDEAKGKKLDNTVLHIEGLADYLAGQPPGNTVAVGMRYHAQRVFTHARAHGLANMQYVAAEDVLDATGKMEEYASYLPYLSEVERSEWGLRLLSRFNPNGSFFKAIMKRTGPRVVDVIDTKAGPRFISTFARKRQTEEQQKLLARAR